MQVTSEPPLWVLDHIWWEERTLELEAHGQPDFAAFAGSTLRGALGAVIRPELCLRHGACGEQCDIPTSCPFFSLFEQSRNAAGTGPNRLKPLIQEPPLSADLANLAAGAPVRPPFEIAPASPIPLLRNDSRTSLLPGTRISVTLRGLGQAGAALDGIVEGVRRNGLEVKGGRLHLTGCHGGRQQFPPPPSQPVQLLRLELLTPTIIRIGEATCFEPTALARAVLEQSVVRTVQVYNHFFSRETGKAPFTQVSFPRATLTSHRLFHYLLSRHSYRQEKWMDFDGAVGWMEWEGDLTSALPWLRAAEILHIGQKATFGLGKIRISRAEHA